MTPANSFRLRRAARPGGPPSDDTPLWKRSACANSCARQVSVDSRAFASTPSPSRASAPSNTVFWVSLKRVREAYCTASDVFKAIGWSAQSAAHTCRQEAICLFRQSNLVPSRCETHRSRDALESCEDTFHLGCSRTLAVSCASSRRDAGAKAVRVGSSAWFGEVSLQASVRLFIHMLRR